MAPTSSPSPVPGPWIVHLGRWSKGIDIRHSKRATHSKITLPKMEMAGKDSGERNHRWRRVGSRERETGSNRIEGAVSRPQSILLLSSTMTSLCQTD
jgi:hypothetical protein